jgi:ribonucleoside-diphosphate reductase alpha chain
MSAEPQFKAIRRRLPDTRRSVIHKFSVSGYEGYLTVGLFEDGQPGELFITMAKEGSTLGGLMDCIGRLVSLLLQTGTSVEILVRKFEGQTFEPRGYTSNSKIPVCTSIIDYTFRWMALRFPGRDLPKGSADGPH